MIKYYTFVNIYDIYNNHPYMYFKNTFEWRLRLSDIVSTLLLSDSIRRHYKPRDCHKNSQFPISYVKTFHILRSFLYKWVRYVRETHKTLKITFNQFFDHSTKLIFSCFSFFKYTYFSEWIKYLKITKNINLTYLRLYSTRMNTIRGNSFADFVPWNEMKILPYAMFVWSINIL